MISQKDVVTMKVPFPNIDSGLAVFPHMYICMKNEIEKHFIKCQTLKPYHLGENKEPIKRVIGDSDINKNPFRKKTIIDCDKLFVIAGVAISLDLLTSSRRDVSDEVFLEVESTSFHEDLQLHELDRDLLLVLNSKITLLN